MTAVVMAWMHGFGNGLFFGCVLAWALSWPKAKSRADGVEGRTK
jgi:hypothetical protein